MTVKSRSKSIADLLFVSIALLGVTLDAQQRAQPVPPPVGGKATALAVSGAGSIPSDYTIGPEDVLSIVYWRDKDMSADVAVRPDGKISLALLNDVQAAGF